MGKFDTAIACCPKCRGNKLIYVIASKKEEGSITCMKCKFDVFGKTDAIVMQEWKSAHFWQNAEDAAKEVKKWPKWKQDCARYFMSDLTNEDKGAE